MQKLARPLAAQRRCPYVGRGFADADFDVAQRRLIARLNPARSTTRAESRISKARFRLTIESERQGKTG